MTLFIACHFFKVLSMDTLRKYVRLFYSLGIGVIPILFRVIPGSEYKVMNVSDCAWSIIYGSGS